MREEVFSLIIRPVFDCTQVTDECFIEVKRMRWNLNEMRLGQASIDWSKSSSSFKYIVSEKDSIIENSNE